MKLEFYQKIFQKPSVEADLPCGRTDGLTDMTKLIVAVRNFANAPKNRSRRTRHEHEVTKLHGGQSLMRNRYLISTLRNLPPFNTYTLMAVPTLSQLRAIRSQTSCHLRLDSQLLPRPPLLSPLVLMVKVSYREDKTLGSKKRYEARNLS